MKAHLPNLDVVLASSFGFTPPMIFSKMRDTEQNTDGRTRLRSSWSDSGERRWLGSAGKKTAAPERMGEWYASICSEICDRGSRQSTRSVLLITANALAAAAVNVTLAWLRRTGR